MIDNNMNFDLWTPSPPRDQLHDHIKMILRLNQKKAHEFAFYYAKSFGPCVLRYINGDHNTPLNSIAIFLREIHFNHDLAILCKTWWKNPTLFHSLDLSQGNFFFFSYIKLSFIDHDLFHIILNSFSNVKKDIAIGEKKRSI